MDPKPRILVVDDEPGVRFYLNEVLSGEGYDVAAVESGEHALELARTQQFDLALIDLKLKGIGGMEVLSAVRRYSPDTAVIVLTAHASLETAVEALHEGAHDYLFKPCKTVELRESIRTGLLKRHRELRQRQLLTELEHSLASSLQEVRGTFEWPAAAAAVPAAEEDDEQGRFLQQGSLIVDLMRHVVTLDGHLLELSPTEFHLLAYLASEAPRVVGAQELVREVQGFESDPWEANQLVRHHVYRIRRKAKDVPDHTQIVRTVRGVGYTVGG